jgi:hypothetical protein
VEFEAMSPMHFWSLEEDDGEIGTVDSIKIRRELGGSTIFYYQNVTNPNIR